MSDKEEKYDDKFDDAVVDEVRGGLIDEEILDLDQRRRRLIEGLIGSADEKLDGEIQIEEEKRPSREKPTTPSTEANFDRKGTAIAGPFARRRLRPIEQRAKPASPDNPRRGVQRIWKDRPINNV